MKQIIYFPAVKRWGEGGSVGQGGHRRPVFLVFGPILGGAGVGELKGSATSGWAEHCKERGHGRLPVHGCAQGCTGLHDDAQADRGAQRWTGLHQEAQECTSIQRCARVCKGTQ